MATTLTPTIKLTVSGTHVNVTDLQTVTASLNDAIQFALTNGTGDDNVDLIYSDQLTVGDGATVDLDLIGALTDPVYGETFDLVKLKAVIIWSTAAGNGEIAIGGDANSVPLFTAVGDSLILPPAGLFVWIAPKDGVAVTADTGDILQLVDDGSATGSVLDIWILGTSA